jgi:peptide/nickel transport system substrate-binding protein
VRQIGHGRLTVTFAAACVLALLGSACGGGDGSSDEGSGTAAPLGDEVRIAVGEDIWPLTGRGPSSKAFAAGEVNVNVYEPLTRLGSDYSVRPGLADRWELVDPTTWRFHLRHGVTFHDGRPFGADDVVWSWTGRQFLPTAITDTLVTVTKVDEHTVDFVLTAANLRLPEQLVHPEGPIVPRNGHNDDQPPVGTGPYRVVEYRPRQRVVVERFDEYWGDKARIRRLTFLFMPDVETRVEALQERDVDVVAGPPRESAASLEADGRFRVVQAPPGATQQLSFNASGQAPNDIGADKAVRQAVALALDRRAYVAEVLKGFGEPGRWMSPPSVLGPSGSAVEAVPHDPARARAVLDQAGWTPGPDGTRNRGGRRLTLTLIGGPAAPEDALPFVQSQLRGVGIEVAVKKADETITLDRFRDAGYDLELGAANQNDGNPAFLPGLRASGERLPPGLALEDEVAAALAAPSLEQVQAVAAALMKTLVVDEYAVVPLAGISRMYALREGVDIADLHPSAINQSWATVTAGG